MYIWDFTSSILAYSTVTAIVLVCGLSALYFYGFKPWMKWMDESLLKYRPKDEPENQNSGSVNPDIVLYLFMYLPICIRWIFHKRSLTDYAVLMAKAFFGIWISYTLFSRMTG